MNESEALEKVEKLTDDQFYAIAKEVSGFSFVSASAKAILRDIIKEKEPEAILETPTEAIIEQEVAAPVIEETPEIIPTVEEKTETPAEEVAPAIEEKIEEPVVPIVEETPTEPVEETVTETPVVEETTEPAVEVTETPVVAEVVAEPIRLPEHEKVAGHEKQIANLNTLLEIEDDDDAKTTIQKKIKFYQLMLNNAKKELEAALASQSLNSTDRPVFKDKLEEANRVMENVKLPQELAAPANGNTKDARLVVNMYMGLQNPAVEDEETQAENEASCKKHYNKLTAEEKAFVDQKLSDYNVTINPKEELKDGGEVDDKLDREGHFTITVGRYGGEGIISKEKPRLYSLPGFINFKYAYNKAKDISKEAFFVQLSDDDSSSEDNKYFRDGVEVSKESVW